MKPFSFAPAPLALAALATLSPLADAQLTPDSSKPTVYRLDGQSLFIEACFPPCACPTVIAGNFRGTFGLKRVASQDPLFDRVFQVSDVNWLVDIAGEERRVSGSGLWRFTTRAAGNLQELTLDLALDDESGTAFDSGLVPVTVDFPNLAIAVDMNDQACMDTILSISAQPVPKAEFERWGINSGDYFSGCLPPCQCIAVFLGSLAGSFDRILLSDNGTVAEYAIVNVDWILQPDFPGQVTTLRGAGIARFTQTGPGPPTQELVLDLVTDTSNPTPGLLTVDRWRTGPGVSTAPTDPRFMSFSVNTNQLVCIDTILTVGARRFP